MGNMTIEELKQGGIYVIESNTTEFICCFDRLEPIYELSAMAIRDFFCLATRKDGLYTLRFVCNTDPLTLNPLSIREATKEEIIILFRLTRQELLRYEIQNKKNIK